MKPVTIMRIPKYHWSRLLRVDFDGPPTVVASGHGHWVRWELVRPFLLRLDKLEKQQERLPEEDGLRSEWAKLVRVAEISARWHRGDPHTTKEEVYVVLDAWNPNWRTEV